MTEKIAFKSWAKKLTKNVKNRFFKIDYVTTSENVGQNQKPFLKRFFLVVFENGIKNYSTRSDD